MTDFEPELEVIPFVDQTTLVPLSVEWSQEQYTKIFSSVVLGASFTYPSEMQQITAWFLKIVEATVTCEQIIDCIQTDPDTAMALQQWLSDNGYGSPSQNPYGTPLSPQTYNSNPLLIDGSAIEDCDNDILFGAITQLIEFIHDSWFGFFETLEAQSNGFERAAIVGEGVPISDTIGVDTVANTFDQVLEEIGENYNANATQTLFDEYRCDIFCLVKNTCELDFQTFADYFMNRMSASITEDAFGDAVSWFVAGSFSGSQIVDAAFALCCQALAYGSQVAGIDMAGLAGGMLAAMNDPDPDWTLLCEDCPSDFCDNYTSSQGSLTIVAGNGSYSAGNGWASVDVGATVRFTIQKALPASSTVTRISFKLRSVGFSYTTVTIPLEITNGAANVVIASFDIALMQGTVNELEFVHETDFTTTNIWLRFDVSGNANGTIYLTELCVEPQGA